MSKQVKDMIVKEYRSRFAGLDGAVLVEIRGMSNTDTAAMRGKLREGKVRVTIVR
ncbi:MAG: 50S ribosomal protein L10, partial [Phycisphaerales bacterium]|nr:50S ribosomal protein L10 [Phycisphaerales bacterium]